MAVATVSGGSPNAGASLANNPSVSDLTKTILAGVNATGGLFTIDSGAGTPSSPALAQGPNNSVFVVDVPNAVVQVGNQQSTYVISDAPATIAGGTGSGTIVGGVGTVAGAAATAVDGSGSAAATALAGSLLGTSTAPGGSYQLLGNIGNDTIIAAAGNNTIQGGAGTNIHGIFGGNNLIGVGQVAGSSDTAFVAGGSNTIFGGSVSSLVGVTGGSNTIVGGAAAETIVAAGGSSTISGGAGRDVFLFTRGANGAASNAVVRDFGVGGTADTIAFVGLGVTNVDALLSTATESGGSVTVRFASSNVSVTFENTTVAALRGNIILG